MKLLPNKGNVTDYKSFSEADGDSDVSIEGSEESIIDITDTIEYSDLKRRYTQVRYNLIFVIENLDFQLIAQVSLSNGTRIIYSEKLCYGSLIPTDVMKFVLRQFT